MITVVSPDHMIVTWSLNCSSKSYYASKSEVIPGMLLYELTVILLTLKFIEIPLAKLNVRVLNFFFLTSMNFIPI